MRSITNKRRKSISGLEIVAERFLFKKNVSQNRKLTNVLLA